VVDTSEHLWIPTLGENIYFIALFDDATNNPQNAKFVLTDSTLEDMKVLDKRKRKPTPWIHFYFAKKMTFSCYNSRP